MAVGVRVNLSGELESYLRGLDLNTPNAQELINWSCNLTLVQREVVGDSPRKVRGVGESTKQKVGILWFWGADAQEFPGGLLRLDPAFACAEPPSS